MRESLVIICSTHQIGKGGTIICHIGLPLKRQSHYCLDWTHQNEEGEKKNLTIPRMIQMSHEICYELFKNKNKQTYK